MDKFNDSLQKSLLSQCCNVEAEGLGDCYRVITQACREPGALITFRTHAVAGLCGNTHLVFLFASASGTVTS